MEKDWHHRRCLIIYRYLYSNFSFNSRSDFPGCDCRIAVSIVVIKVGRNLYNKGNEKYEAKIEKMK